MQIFFCWPRGPVPHPYLFFRRDAHGCIDNISLTKAFMYRSRAAPNEEQKCQEAERIAGQIHRGARKVGRWCDGRGADEHHPPIGEASTARPSGEEPIVEGTTQSHLGRKRRRAEKRRALCQPPRHQRLLLRENRFESFPFGSQTLQEWPFFFRSTARSSSSFINWR